MASRRIASAVSASSKIRVGLVTALGPVLGYETCSRIARRALDEQRSVAEIVLEEGLLTEARLIELLRLEALTRPSRIVMAASDKSREANESWLDYFGATGCCTSSSHVETSGILAEPSILRIEPSRPISKVTGISPCHLGSTS